MATTASVLSVGLFTEVKKQLVLLKVLLVYSRNYTTLSVGTYKRRRSQMQFWIFFLIIFWVLCSIPRRPTTFQNSSLRLKISTQT